MVHELCRSLVCPSDKLVDLSKTRQTSAESYPSSLFCLSLVKLQQNEYEGYFSLSLSFFFL